MTDKETGFFVNARLWEPIQPIDRGDRYEDPLQEALEKEGLGEVTGGGSLLGNNGEIEYVDIDMELVSTDGIEVVKAALEAAGAPAGSLLLYERDGEHVEVGFGRTQGLAIYLDGVGLPDQVYEQSNIDDLADMIIVALGNGALGEIHGSWQGPERTAIYIYGRSAEEMFAAVEKVLRDYPLCQNAIVVIGHGRSSPNPREVVIPIMP